jgi:hypothetical protein
MRVLRFPAAPSLGPCNPIPTLSAPTMPATPESSRADLPPAKKLSPVFSGDQLDSELTPPGPLRLSGIVALVLGLLSISALAGTAMLGVPLLGVLVGLFALRPDQNAEARTGGRLPALIGLVLSLFFGSWGGAHHATRHHFVTAEAERFGLEWLTLLSEGRKEVAHELTQPAGSRQIHAVPLEAYYAQQVDPTSPFQEFLANGPVESILKAGDRCRWELVEVVQRRVHSDRENLVLRFRDRSGAVSHAVDLPMHRFKEGGADRVEWMIGEPRWAAADGSGAPKPSPWDHHPTY